ncbi:MAG: hypothetical protein O6848_01345 [Bacteroidetes bacterium]|nr:hypothetical protein [Bacteroidota bacterium]
MMNSRRSLFLVLLITLSLTALSQNQNVSQEVRDAVAMAKSQMDEGDYAFANKIFRKILKEKQVMPSEMCYYFAETLFMLEQYQNSQNFTDKYLELTGKAGDYYEQIMDLRKLLRQKVNANEFCDYCDVNGYRLAPCSNCKQLGKVHQTCHRCKGAGVTTCRLCLGEGVVIRKNQLGEDEYQSCPLCDSKGFETCQLCLGNKEIESTCEVCLGSGKERTHLICNHEPPLNDDFSIR